MRDIDKLINLGVNTAVTGVVLSVLPILFVIGVAGTVSIHACEVVDKIKKTVGR